MVCKLPMVEVGEFQLGENELRRLEWSQLGELQQVRTLRGGPKKEKGEAVPGRDEPAVGSVLAAEPALVERFVPLLAGRGVELTRQATAQLSPGERQLLCTLCVQPSGPDHLGASLAAIFTRRFRSTVRLRGRRRTLIRR